MNLENEGFHADEQEQREVRRQDEPESRDDNRQNVPEPVKPWVIALIFAGLAVLAVVVCAILWRFTHNEAQNSGTGDVNVAESSEPSQSGESTSAPKEQTTAYVDETHTDNMTDEGDDSGIDQKEDPSTEPGNPSASMSGTGDSSASKPETGDSSASMSETEDSSASMSETEDPSASTTETEALSTSAQEIENPLASIPETEDPFVSMPEARIPSASRQAEALFSPQEPGNGDASMSFNAVQDSVTPKDVVNLRSVPNTSDENTIVAQSSNGEVLTRIGVNPNTGWSEIDYDGQIVYAVSRYLTTDLNYKVPTQPSNPDIVSTVSGRVIIFTDCDDNMTPKEYVNLRTEPSTTEGDTTVRCQANSGETIHRTGYSADFGWSRVEYNGEVLYVVTSLMLVQ